MVLNSKNVVHMLMSLALTFSSITATALTCPGPQDFVISHKDNKWGWHWDLRPDHDPIFNFVWTNASVMSPLEKDFSPNYPLHVKIYFYDLISTSVICNYSIPYPLSDGKLEVHTSAIQVSENGKNKIAHAWTLQGSAVSPRWGGGGFVYECSTTAGAADKCSVDLVN